MALPGPSRTITVDPAERPSRPSRPAPERKPEPSRPEPAPSKRPSREREREKSPA